MKKFLLLIFLSSCAGSDAMRGVPDVESLDIAKPRLEWNQNIESDLKGYKIYRRLPDSLFQFWRDAGLATQYPLADRDGLLHFYVLTAYDTAGNESGFSNEVFWLSAAADTIIQWPVDRPLKFLLQYDATKDTLGFPLPSPGTLAPQLEFGLTDFLRVTPIKSGDTLTIGAGVFVPGQKFKFRARIVDNSTGKASRWVYTVETLAFTIAAANVGVPRAPTFRVIK